VVAARYDDERAQRALEVRITERALLLSEVCEKRRGKVDCGVDDVGYDYVGADPTMKWWLSSRSRECKERPSAEVLESMLSLFSKGSWSSKAASTEVVEVREVEHDVVVGAGNASTSGVALAATSGFCAERPSRVSADVTWTAAVLVLATELMSSRCTSRCRASSSTTRPVLRGEVIGKAELVFLGAARA
jgi:hypothetical protein